MTDQDKKRAAADESANASPEEGSLPAAGESTGVTKTSEKETPAATVEEEIAHLRDRLAACEESAKKSEDKFLRERAELENFKKRTRREQADALRYANEPLIRELIPVVDNLERALEHAAGGGNGAPLIEGVSLVLKSLHDVLKRHGVATADALVGAAFDPTKHEAVARQEVKGEANRVVAQHERGYFLHDRLLRPAKVVVSYRKTPESGVENGGNDD